MTTQLTPEEKFDLMQEYPGFVFRQDIGEFSVIYTAYLTFPSGEDSNHFYDEDRDAVIDKIFGRYITLVLNTCCIVEMAKRRLTK